MNYDYQYSGYPNQNVQEPEEEEIWDRECFLDPFWEIQQKKTFTAWINSYLRKAKTSIENIEEDLRNGLKLMLLLEILAEEPLPKADRGKMRFHKIANVNKALEYIESKGVQLISIGAEEIVDGNVKMTLGMIWTIILRFCIQDITVEELSAKEGLLLWCQRKTASYKNCNVQNFHMSWKDGLAFCALIHKHRPDLIDYSKLSKDNPIENLNYAFDIAEKKLDIPRMLDAEDMVNNVKPDERSVMTYVAAYYHAFAGAQKAESAANRLSKILKINQENEKMMREYETIASDLLKWILSKIPFLEKKQHDDTIESTMEILKEYQNYRGGEKPPRVEEKGNLDSLYETLQTRLRLANRPAFRPSEGKLISDIHQAWSEMEGLERGFQDWIIGEIRRLERINYLVEKFNTKLKNHQAWSDAKEEALPKGDLKNCYEINKLQAISKKQQSFENELGHHQPKIETLIGIAEELNQLKYKDVGDINKKAQNLVSNWDSLGLMNENLKESIRDKLNLLEKIDQIHQTNAKRIGPINAMIEDANDDLQDVHKPESFEEISRLRGMHESFKSYLPNAEAEINSIISNVNLIENIIKENSLPDSLNTNPYSNINFSKLSNRWSEMKSLIPQYENQLDGHVKAQQINESFKQEQAKISNTIGPWIEKTTRNMEAIVMSPTSAQNTLENKLKLLEKIDEDISKYKPVYVQLQEVNKQLQNVTLSRNPHTRYSIEEIRSSWENLITQTKRAQCGLNVDIMKRDYKGLNAEQISEYKRCFNHFDKAKNKRLDHLEFRACLTALGINVSNNSQGDAEFRRLLKIMDPKNTGYVTYDLFVNYMNRQSSENYSPEQIIESFRTLANDEPYITSAILRRELPEEQADYCIANMKPYEGDKPNTNDTFLDYTTFPDRLTGQVGEF